MDDGGERGALDGTYRGAVRRDLASFPDATLVGVFDGADDAPAVDEGRSELALPAALHERFERRREALCARGMCEEGAHNAAWEELSVEERYEDHLATAPASDALTALERRLRDGEDLILVGEPGENSRCHRRLLVDRLRDRLE